ncbi:S41 family peptidase [Moraxella nasovis]|uniref:S41 family peptidase n=1 Tax=Moraxella nasovis TaxID=2904121 RepID=UPI001F613F77|nr:S41 family peptidase [Moraxella nasovis]UNU73127.1 S41 family peptidase [Moraxella nasovis]
MMTLGNFVKLTLVAAVYGVMSVSAVAQVSPNDGYDETVNPALQALGGEPDVLHGIDGLHQGRVPLNTISPEVLKTFVAVVDLVRREYPENLSDEKLFEYAIRGMLQKVDSHADFLDAENYADLQSFTSGDIADVGLWATWQKDKGQWVVTRVVDGMSAMSEGVEEGDFIHKIGDIQLDGSQTDNDVAQLLSGILNTEVAVVLSKSGRSKRTVSLVRNHPKKSQIEMLSKDGVIIIKLPVFQNNTREQILQGLTGVDKVQGIIIDVRNNPGGVLESAVDVASLFMRDQTITQIQGKNGSNRVLKTTRSPLLDELPLMILQNRYSASASEVLASSLQEQKRALIVGESSYGKGSVQSVIPLGDGQAVKLTTAHYLTAKGVKIDGVGVKADVNFPKNTSDDRVDDWLERALALMEKAKLAKGVEFTPVGGF